MNGIRYGVSCWLEGVSKRQRPGWPRMRGDITADVAIVGGGLAGCTAAYVFAQAGLRAVVLEAERVGQAATACGPGLFDAGAAARFSDLRTRFGLRAARHMWEASRLAGLDAQALIRRLRLRCGLQRLDVTEVATSEETLTALQREHRALDEAGLESAWLTGARASAATGLHVRAALKRPDGGWADPYRLVLGLAHHAERRGAAIFEQSPVRRVKVGTRQVAVVSDAGAVTAAAVIVAAGRPAPDLSALHRHVKAVETTVAVVPALPAAARRAFGAAEGVTRDLLDIPHAWRLGEDGTLVVWQAGQPPVSPRQRGAVDVQRTGQLMYELSVLYPAISGLLPSHGWTVPTYRSADGLVIAGPHRSFPRHLFAVGLGADGLQGAFLAARLNLRHFLGAPAKGDELFGFLR